MGFFSKFRSKKEESPQEEQLNLSMEKTRQGFVSKVFGILGGREIDDDLYEELEEALAALLSPSMAPDALESFLARAMTAAAGHGASAVAAEAEEDADA